jgi:hypothetical protein
MGRNAIGAWFALAVVLLCPNLAQAQWIRTGVLTCDVSAGIGLIIGSQRAVRCTFAPDPGGPPEYYDGTITKFGLDVGVTGGGVMVWGAYNQTSSRGIGFLAGEYAGASGEVTIAAGLGANVLFGGSNRTVALQPLSVGGQIGLNLALGVANLVLRPSR